MVPTPHSLARAFAARVAGDLAEHLPVIVARNATAAYAGACATHDFCDANEMMLDAWLDAAGTECDVEDDAHAAIWNAAWDIARAAGFDVSAIPQE